MENVSERPERPETWAELNARRLALIRKRYAEGLTDSEERELEALQGVAAKTLEPADRRRFEHVNSLAQWRSVRTDDWFS